MKRLMKYYREKKGITLVLIALMLAVLLFFLGMAVDISYMYNVKNQLQVAADAAALAGAANLGGSDTTQPAARQAAWKFACKNRAANQAVFLSTTDGEDTITPNCDKSSLPAAADLNGTNNPNGDIVVGDWNPSRPQTPDDLRFCAYNDACWDASTMSINALKARPRMTGETVPGETGPPPMPKAKVFIGQVFRLIGIDWSRMSARASAIASFQPPQWAPFPTCIPSCGLKTPLKTTWGYDSGEPDPIHCTDPHLPSGSGNSNSDDSFVASSTPGQLFLLGPSVEASGVKQPGIAWTNFDINDCDVNPACDHPSGGEISPYIQGTSTPPDICHHNICTTNGTIANLLGAGPNPNIDTVGGQLLAKGRIHSFDTATGPININGWEVVVPILSDVSCGTSGPCPGTMAASANPYYVVGFTKALITEPVSGGAGGAHGIRFVGLGNVRQETFTFQCNGHGHSIETKTITRWVSDFDAATCSDCTQQLPSEFSKVHLVK